MAGHNPQELDKDDIHGLLVRLGERLDARGITAELYIVGGAAMALAYNSQRVTGDIDAIIIPSDVVLDEAAAMAAEFGLDPEWLNDKVRMSLPNSPDPSPREAFSARGISVRVASPEYLLGMKSTTSRMSDKDKGDAARLCRLLGIETTDQLIDVVDKAVPSSLSLEPRRWFLDEIIKDSKQVDLPEVDSQQALHPASAGCRHWLPRAKRYCSLPEGHHGQHR